MGEPAGIGPEVIVKALSDPVLRHKAHFIIYGMNELLHYAADLAEFDVFWWRDQYNGRLRNYPHDVVVVDYDQYSMLGTAIRAPSKMGGEASMRFCLDAIDAANRKLIDGIVTGPIAKQSWKLAGYHFPGHTELFAQRTGSRRFAMMFAGGPLKVVLATVHIPLMGLWGRLNIGAVFQPIELVHQALVEWFDIPKPRIAVCGLNPHASENGQFGDEEERIIEPAILMAKDQGVDVSGPYPSDTIFMRARRIFRRGGGDVSRSGSDSGEAAGVRSGGERHLGIANHPHQPGSRDGVRHRRTEPGESGKHARGHRTGDRSGGEKASAIAESGACAESVEEVKPGRGVCRNFRVPKTAGGPAGSIWKVSRPVLRTVIIARMFGHARERRRRASVDKAGMCPVPFGTAMRQRRMAA